MTLDIQTLHKWFDHFNHLCFNGELPEPRLMLSKSRTQLGSMTYRRQSRCVISSVSTYTIRVSTYYDCPEEQLQDVLLHEMIHYYISLNHLRDTSSHGILFCQMMNDINQKFHRHITISSRMSNHNIAIQSQKHRARLVLGLEMNNGTHFLSVVNPHYAQEIKRTIKTIREIRRSHWFVSADAYFNNFPTVRSLRARKVEFETFKQKFDGGVQFEF